MNIERFFAKISFSQEKKTRILRTMQRLNKAGIPTSTTLDTLYDMYSQGGKKPKKSTAIAINEWRSRYNGGRSLSASMSGWISLSEEMIIEAGEQSDKLSLAMTDALEASKAGRKIRKTIRNALSYPIVMMAALCFMLYGYSIKIIPTFSEVVDPSLWTGNARRMYHLSQFVTTWLPLMVAVLVVLGIIITISLPRARGRLRTFLDRFPPYSIYKVISGASFMMSMRGFIAAGIQVPEALRRIARGSNPYIRNRTEAILAQVNAGRNLGEAMTRAGHNFPDNDINDEISIYAGLNNFSDNLDVLAKEWIEGAVERTEQTSKILFNIALVLLGGTVAFMAVSMFELQDIITRSTGM